MEIVKLLSVRGDVDVDAEDNEGQTPRSSAEAGMKRHQAIGRCGVFCNCSKSRVIIELLRAAIQERSIMAERTSDDSAGQQHLLPPVAPKE